ncbi:transglutaminaseTgpA domain-containing protein [Microbacterium sp. ASV81]|uniref:TransglutaminaseTgpA domain-containing protein n=1 Tax=Microbacterium capsulatum TaxID=3041921 RepID=A0ABU0XEB7_9MICO|nr:transglutaminaseTgpA domain-containing protein [Microbacterium sp. ASV81]MDQ4213459.1 transglutaminaseTgpA domain-containing protein [Microbacterium sp. ASV81]
MKSRSWTDVTVIVVLIGLAIVPLSSAFQSIGFWVAASAGTLLGALIAVLGAWRRWGVLVVAAAVVVAYFLVGGAIGHGDIALFGVVPTLSVLSALATDAVEVWRQLLTLPAPFQGFGSLVIGPFIAALIAATVAVTIAVRVRRVLFALIPTGMLLVFAMAFSTYLGSFPVAVGAAFALVGVSWAAWWAQRARHAGELAVVGEQAPSRSGRVVGAAIAGAIVVAAAAGGGAAAAIAAPNRDVLRDHVVPPLELHDYASPLMSFRKWTRDGSDSSLFDVTGLPDGVPVRLATLDLYDGIVYKVSGSGGPGSGVFSRLGRSVDDPLHGTRARIGITIDDLGGVWMPTVGYLDDFAAEGKVDAEAVNYNAATGTAVVTTGLSKGSHYTLDVTVPATPTDAQLAKAQVAKISMPAPAKIPDAISGIIGDTVPSTGTPIEQIKALEAFFRKGYFSHGLAGQAASRSGHSLNREQALVGQEQMIGDDEQYSVAMALALAQMGVPSRVVLGFTPAAGKTAVTGKDVHAWVEVPFDGAGWVAFHPTPPEDRIPTEQAPKPRQKPRAQVAQPPQQPQEPAQLPPAPPVEDSQKGHQPVDLGWLWATLQITGLSLLVLLVLCGPSIALAILQARRRRGRAGRGGSVGRVDGGWAELIDAAGDVGYAVPRGGTRREQGAALDARVPEGGAVALAHRADAAVFGAGEPDEADARQYWADTEQARVLLARAMPWHRRVRARLFPASVLRGIRRPRLRGFHRPVLRLPLRRKNGEST